MDSFHIRHKWSLAWEGVSRIMISDLDQYLQGHSAMTLQSVRPQRIPCPLCNSDSSGFNIVISKCRLGIKFMSTSCKIAPNECHRTPLMISQYYQVMAWCHQATSHYLSQHWPRCMSPYGITRIQSVKWPLGPSDAIWRQRSGSPLAQVMACCLTAPSHYLNQCWLIISKVEWHSSKGKFTRDTSAINHWNYLENQVPKMSFKFPWGQWVKHLGNFAFTYSSCDGTCYTTSCKSTIVKTVSLYYSLKNGNHFEESFYATWWKLFCCAFILTKHDWNNLVISFMHDVILRKYIDKAYSL